MYSIAKEPVNLERYLRLIAGEFAIWGLASGYYVSPHGLLFTAGKRFRQNNSDHAPALRKTPIIRHDEGRVQHRLVRERRSFKVERKRKNTSYIYCV